MSSAFQQSENQRRTNNLLSFGVVFAVDYDNALYRVRDGELESDWLPQLVRRAGGDVTWHPLELGEQVVFLQESGADVSGVILGSIYQQQHAAPSSDHNERVVRFDGGATIRYNRKNKHYDMVLPDGGTVSIKSTGGVKIVGDLEVIGNAVIDGISFNTHGHKDVQEGKGTSGLPES